MADTLDESVDAVTDMHAVVKDSDRGAVAHESPTYTSYASKYKRMELPPSAGALPPSTTRSANRPNTHRPEKRTPAGRN